MGSITVHRQRGVRTRAETSDIHHGEKTDFLDSMNTNPYFFRNYDVTYFALNVNGKQIPTEGLDLNVGHEKTSVMEYRTLFEASGIHHSNSELQISHDMYINGYFMLFST